MNREISRFVEILSKNIWDKKINNLEAELRSSKTPFYKNFLIDRNPLLLPLREYFQLKKEGKTIWKHKNEELVRLFSFAWCINKMYHQVGEAGKSKIKGCLFSDEINPFLFEVQTVIHFLQNKFELLLNDLESTDSTRSNYDFLVKRGSFIGEIECKRKNVDAGNKVPRPLFYQLADKIVHKILPLKKNLLININIEKRLEGNVHYFNELSKYVYNAVLSGKNEFVFDDNLSVEVIRLKDSTVISNDLEAAKFVAQYYSEKAHFAIRGNGWVSIVRAESQSFNELLYSIYRSLKQATSQFSGNYPCMISCFIEGISEQEFAILCEEGDLRRLASNFLYGTDRRFIHTVSFTSEQSLVKRGNLRFLIGTAIYWENPQCSFSTVENPFGFRKK